MPLRALQDDALTRMDDGCEVRIALPWIRSLPLHCVHDLAVSIDGAPITPVTVRLGSRRVAAGALADQSGWWYLQDRLVIDGPPLEPGVHEVSVRFDLDVPYLAAGPHGPLRLPHRDVRAFDATPVRLAASRDVA
jgi:hypothetical protein